MPFQSVVHIRGQFFYSECLRFTLNGRIRCKESLGLTDLISQRQSVGHILCVDVFGSYFYLEGLMDESLSLPGAMTLSRADSGDRTEAGTAEKTEGATVAWPAPPATPPTNCPSSPNYSSSLYNRTTLQLLSLCTEVPGLVLYVVWLVAFAGLCAGTQYLAHTCEVTGLRENKVAVASTSDLSEQDRSRILFVQALAAAIFGVGTWIQMSALLFQISAKKRQLSSFVAYVNLVSMSTYVATLCGWLPVLYGWNGHPLQMRYVEWVSATPIMLLCLAALGGTMQDGLVQDWPLASKTMFWDVFMVTMGLVQSAVQSEDIGQSRFS
jgi:hypothetical protein